ncbi:MAG: DNA mismatch repair protein MutH [Deltaproteobacteria bacterium]|nr:DNA mismatch repair protein MutH [Deltaproteobacteria bacterium]
MVTPVTVTPVTELSEAALVARAQALAGRALAELPRGVFARVPVARGAPLRGVSLRGKGAMGTLVERALGIAPSSSPEPDLPALGIEVKTLPVVRGRLRESTWVCSATPTALLRETWVTSRVRARLARVLFVPIDVDASALLARRVGTPFLWSPSDEDEALLRRDWEDLADLVAHGLASPRSARRGCVLQLRPKGRDAEQLRRAIASDGEPYLTRPLGFYLRRAFGQRILDATFLQGDERYRRS